MLDLPNSDEKTQRIEIESSQIEFNTNRKVANTLPRFVFNQKIDLINSIKIVEFGKVYTPRNPYLGINCLVWNEYGFFVNSISRSGNGSCKLTKWSAENPV